MRTLQRFATVCFLGAAAAASISACGSSDSGTPTPAVAGAPAAAGGRAGGAGGAGGASTGSGGSGSAGAPALTGNAASGEALYKKEKIVCNSCHGDNAEGKLGPNITGSMTAGIGSWTAAQFHDAVRSGKNRKGATLYLMPPFDATYLSDQDIADLRAFTQSKMSDVAVKGMYCESGPCTGAN